jgi:hypothetical protein
MLTIQLMYAHDIDAFKLYWSEYNHDRDFPPTSDYDTLILSKAINIDLTRNGTLIADADSAVPFHYEPSQLHRRLSFTISMNPFDHSPSVFHRCRAEYVRVDKVPVLIDYEQAVSSP